MTTTETADGDITEGSPPLHLLLVDLDNCATRLRVLRRFVRALLAAAGP